MQYLTILLTILLGISFPQSQTMIVDKGELIQLDETITENAICLLTNEDNDKIVKQHKIFSQWAIDQQATFSRVLLSSPIYLLKRQQLLLVIKYNTTYYTHLF
ncbi:hypothetical protein DS745_19915 [Anaerobacillus alkaliphilus]|uniref:Uncharacterized protein n=1 Tax=Anaerobacillus alkaliphilus TaxID=1548597 RepID=A0A4Q0VRF2_9BACI|nr:hypothetical protein [Anaerobacillus alkaliphilus]RXI98585.1 hypothetical protein DS745_19915 [Anaerobacillus alkaliphilus]